MIDYKALVNTDIRCAKVDGRLLRVYLEYLRRAPGEGEPATWRSDIVEALRILE